MKALALLLLILFAGSAPEQSFVLPADIVEPHLLVAADMSRYTLPKERPTVLIKSREWFLALPACGGDPDCNIMGLYRFNDPTIVYLRVDMPPEARSPILIHELVHWLQQHNSVPAATSCAESAVIEAEAYTAEYKFMVKYQGFTGGFWTADLSCK